MPEFYIIIAGKIFFPDFFFWGGCPPVPPSPTPMVKKLLTPLRVWLVGMWWGQKGNVQGHIWYSYRSFVILVPVTARSLSPYGQSIQSPQCRSRSDVIAPTSSHVGVGRRYAIKSNRTSVIRDGLCGALTGRCSDGHQASEGLSQSQRPAGLKLVRCLACVVLFSQASSPLSLYLDADLTGW